MTQALRQRDRRRCALVCLMRYRNDETTHIPSLPVGGAACRAPTAPPRRGIAAIRRCSDHDGNPVIPLPGVTARRCIGVTSRSTDGATSCFMFPSSSVR
jgi:hypothetical protein